MNPQTNQKSREQYLKMLDEIGKLKKQSSQFLSSDQSPIIPEILGSASAQPGTVAYGTPIASDFPKLKDRTITPNININVDNGQSDTPNGTSYKDFNTMMGQVLGTNNQSNKYGGYSDPTEVYQKTGLPFGVQTLPDGGTLFNDGSVKYSDGTIRDAQGGQIDPSAYGIRTNTDGSIEYSDGSVKRQPVNIRESASQETVAPKNFKDYEGVGGLSQFVFGNQRNVTQPYANYNPEAEIFSGGFNYGTDFQTVGQNDNSLKLPIDVQVVKVMGWDGKDRYNTSTPYGNSVLVKLPNGSMLRLSHLSELPNLREGDTIPAGKVFAQTGDTGNTTGPHLDVEYYNENGQISNPNDFFVAAQKSTPIPSQNENQQNVPEKIQSTSEDQQSIPSQQPINQQITPPISNNSLPNLNDIGNSLSKLPGDISSLNSSNILNSVKQTPIDTANIIDEWNPTGKAGIGITELFRGDVAGAKKELSNTAEMAKTGAGNIFSNTIADLGKNLGLKDRNISETVGGLISGLTPKAYAAEHGQNEPLQSKQDYLDMALNTAGQGISKLKNVFSGVAKNFVGNNMSDMDTRKIGGSPATLPTDSMMTPKDQFQSTQGGINNMSKNISTPIQSTNIAKSTSNNLSIPVPTPVPTPTPTQPSKSNVFSAPSNSSQPQQSKQTYSTPAPAPVYQTKAPAPVYQTKAPAPVYSTPAPKPQYSTPAPKPAPAPQKPAPAPKQNVFTNLVNTIKSWFR